MGIRYVCSQCGYVLYEYRIENGKVKVSPSGFKKEAGLATPKKVIEFYGGKCPRCGKKLRLPSLDNIVIRLPR